MSAVLADFHFLRPWVLLLLAAARKRCGWTP
jgi:hypothetical protein